MRRVFADTLYWAAIINRRDQWHRLALDASLGLTDCRIETTDGVLVEVLATFCGAGPTLRTRAALSVRALLDDPEVEVYPQSRRTFLDGLDLYEARPDKGYSLTDCISMATMRQENITEILTHDVHFTQEGFMILL